MRIDIYTEIKDILESSKEFRTVTLYKDQFNRLPLDASLERPAVLIDIVNVNWKSLSKGVRHGDMVVGIYLIVGANNNLNSSITAENDTAAINLLDKTGEILDGFVFNNGCRLQRVSDKAIKHTSSLSIYRIEYTMLVSLGE